MAEGSWAIGIDVGGTKIAGGIVSLADGRVAKREQVPTMPTRGGEPVLDDAVALADRLHAGALALGYEIASVGIGVAEIVNLDGRVASGYSIGWAELPVADRFGHIARTAIESDVRAAALAEARFGAGRPFDPFIYVTIGTGISYTLIVGGTPYAGARGAALAFASGAVTSTCPACESQHDMILEAYAGGPALASRYMLASGREVPGAEAVLAAAATDPIAAHVIDSAADAVGSALGLLITTLDPAALVIGGGLGSAPGRYHDRVVATTRAHVFYPPARELPILRAALGPDAGLIGAALAGSRTRPTIAGLGH